MTDVAETMQISFSQLSNWNRCQFLWHYKYRDLWSPIDIKDNMKLGTVLHYALKLYYDEIQTNPDNDPVEAVKEWIFSQQTGEYSLETLTQAARIMMRYPEFAIAQDKKFQVLGTEIEFTLNLVSPLGVKYQLVGIIDLVVHNTETDKIWVIDHKSTYRFWNPLEITTDIQLPLYAVACSQMYGELPQIIMVNQIRTYPYKKYETTELEKLFFRDRDNRTRAEYHSILKEVGETVDEIVQWEKNGTPARRNLTRDCQRCDFYDPCLSELKGYGREGFLGMTFKRKGEGVLLPMFDPELENASEIG